MRLIFINYSHPDTPHISAVRVPTFARVLARRGHEVVLATMPKTGDATAMAPLAERLRTHDWREPFLLTWPLRPSSLMLRVQAGKLPAWRRRLLTGWWYLTRGGVRWDWTEAGLPVMAELEKVWKADVVWGSFGQLDVVHLAQRTARTMGCPWCLDIKDNWSLYVPGGMRRWLARRYGDAAAFSVNAGFHLAVSMPYFNRTASVVYSGVDESLYTDATPLADTYDVVVIGSLYGQARFAGFVRGVSAWLDGLTDVERQRIRLIYAGCDGAVAEQGFASVRHACAVEVYGHLPIQQMVAMCRTAAVNCYMWLPKGFHHKLIELLWCRRPILTYPGEHEESVEIARHVGGDLRVCRDPGQVAAALQEVWLAAGRSAAVSEEALREFTWERQANGLEEMLNSLILTGKIDHVVRKG